MTDATRPYRDHEPSFSGVFSRAFLLALVLGLLAYVLWRDFGWRLHDPDAKPRAVTPRGDLAQDEEATIALFEAASPSVVHINTTRVATVRRFLHTNVLEIPEGSGSGFIWDRDGHVVTNYHVIQTADAAEVRLNDHSSYTAHLVGIAPEHDLAVLRIDAPPGKLVPIPVGTSRDLRVGQKTFAIGNPFGLDQTLTTGVISGLDREILSVMKNTIRGVIQTDAAINPGNSGGPLLDSAGRLIGVNTAIQSPSGAYAGVGFAVPVDSINRVVPQLIRTGTVARAGLGVRLAPDSFVRKLGWEGALIAELVEGGAAQAAGLRETTQDGGEMPAFGDLIVALDGTEVRDAEELRSLLQEHEPGDVVEVSVVRDPGGSRTRTSVRVRLQEL